MKQIELTQGKFALVDDADYEELNRYKWYYNEGCAVRQGVLMHRHIMQAKPGQIVRHLDGNGLNCQRSNLAFGTRQTKRPNSTSQFRGVYWNQHRKKWGIQVSLGFFEDETEAAKAYDAFALKTWGDKTLLNFPTKRKG